MLYAVTEIFVLALTRLTGSVFDIITIGQSVKNHLGLLFRVHLQRSIDHDKHIFVFIKDGIDTFLIIRGFDGVLCRRRRFVYLGPHTHGHQKQQKR